MTSPTAAAVIGGLKSKLKQLILEAIRVSYTSESNINRSQTGNHYQSLQLGESRTQGFRSPRFEFLDQIDFSGRKVLDLGCNLGEISRAARARGVG